MSEKPKRSGSAVDKVLTILETITSYPDGISLAELSKITDIAKTTAFRILETLKAREYVSFDDLTDRYSFDIKMLELGIKGLMNANLVEVSIPFLKSLSNKTNETCFLGVYSEQHVVYLYKSEGNMSVQTNSRLGSRKPAYCTAIGKALLAFQGQQEMDIALSQPMHAFTSKTITDRVALYEELADIRLRGYAFDHEEIEEGLTCIAKPIFNYTHDVVGAISIAGPTFRMKSQLDNLLEELSIVCYLISRKLGYISV